VTTYWSKHSEGVAQCVCYWEACNKVILCCGWSSPSTIRHARKTGQLLGDYIPTVPPGLKANWYGFPKVTTINFTDDFIASTACCWVP